MKSPTNQLQKAIIQRLKADSDLTALIARRIYDHVPKEADFPYVSFGVMENRSVLADCLDLAEITIQLDVWSRAAGMVELREIAEAVRSSLQDVDLPLETHAVVYLIHKQTHELYDPDGKTKHGVLMFEATIERL